MKNTMQVSSPGVCAVRNVSGAGLYVDTENLRDPEYARQVVASVVADWPSNRSPLGSISLYVRADKAELWRLWAEDAYPALAVRIRGVQHFSANNSKNSADMAIAADAVSDLVTGRANDVAVVSNDSDFAALFVKVRELAHEANAETVPFLWIHPPEGGALSPEIDEFLPAAFRWDLSAAPSVPAESAAASVSAKPAPRQISGASRPALPAATPNVDGDASNEAIAEELIRQLPVGRFRAADAQEIVGKRWPKHPASGDTAKFGQFLGKEIWPILKKRGVTMPRKSSPRTYEISQAAKDSAAGPPSPRPPSPRPAPGPAPPRQTTTEPTVAELAASIAAGITEEEFSATQALNVLKESQPTHPAASFTAQRFGAWFFEQLWPVMEKHGVVLAKEKPRRYEMTPDARHRLTSLVQARDI